MVARLTGLEPATPGVTGRYSNQLSYNRPLRIHSRECLAVLWPRLRPVKRLRALSDEKISYAEKRHRLRTDVSTGFI